MCIDGTVAGADDAGENKQADTKVDESENQMTVVDDVDVSPSGSVSKQQSRSRSRSGSRSSYSSHKSGKVVIFIPNRESTVPKLNPNQVNISNSEKVKLTHFDFSSLF